MRCGTCYLLLCNNLISSSWPLCLILTFIFRLYLYGLSTTVTPQPRHHLPRVFSQKKTLNLPLHFEDTNTLFYFDLLFSVACITNQNIGGIDSHKTQPDCLSMEVWANDESLCSLWSYSPKRMTPPHSIARIFLWKRPAICRQTEVCWQWVHEK